jgi:hypothetical protein
MTYGVRGGKIDFARVLPSEPDFVQGRWATIEIGAVSMTIGSVTFQLGHDNFWNIPAVAQVYNNTNAPGLFAS